MAGGSSLPIATTTDKMSFLNNCDHHRMIVYKEILVLGFQYVTTSHACFQIISSVINKCFMEWCNPYQPHD